MSNVKAYLEDIVRDGLHDIAEALKGGGPTGDVQASHVIYDNTESGLTSNRVQGAIDDLSTKVDTNASDISDLGDDVSDLTSRMETAEGDITSLDGRLDTAEGDITALETWKDNLDASDIPYGSGTVKDALDDLNKSFTKLQSNSQFVRIPSEAKEFICYVKNSKSANPQYIGYFNVEVLDMTQLNTVWFSDQFFYTYNKPSFTVTIRQSGTNYDAEYMIIYWR